MAIIRKSKASSKHVLYLASGKVGLVIVKQYGNKMVISNLPDMSKVKQSPKQKENTSEWADIQKSAKAIYRDPVAKALYAKMREACPRKFSSLYHFVVSRRKAELKQERLQKERKATLLLSAK